MKLILLYFSLVTTYISMNAQNSIDGTWNTGQDNTKIEISNSIGKIHSSENKKATAGKLIIKELKKIDNSYKGKLFIIRKNQWVDALFIRKESKLIIHISAGSQNKTIVWQLVK